MQLTLDDYINNIVQYNVLRLERINVNILCISSDFKNNCGEFETLSFKTLTHHYLIYFREALNFFIWTRICLTIYIIYGSISRIMHWYSNSPLILVIDHTCGMHSHISLISVLQFNTYNWCDGHVLCNPLIGCLVTHSLVLWECT